jgi:HEAT repeat protein
MNFKMRLYKSFVLLICVSLLAACQPVPPGPPPPVPQSDLGKLKTNLTATDASVRLEAAYELGQRGQAAKDAVDDLIAASTTDPDVQVRVVAAYALGKIGAPVETIAPRLIAILSDQDERTEVRYSATRALGNLGLKC